MEEKEEKGEQDADEIDEVMDEVKEDVEEDAEVVVTEKGKVVTFQRKQTAAQKKLENGGKKKAYALSSLSLLLFPLPLLSTRPSYKITLTFVFLSPQAYTIRAIRSDCRCRMGSEPTVCTSLFFFTTPLLPSHFNSNCSVPYMALAKTFSRIEQTSGR